MPRNFFNILRDNPESWGGKQNPLTLPTTRSSDKAQKSSATVKISAVRFLCYKSRPESLRAEKISSNPRLRLQPVKGHSPAYLLQQSGEQTSPPHEAQRALFYVKTN
ncbi:hypothetical protein ACV2HJ_16165 [Salmonella enterica subsp. enterica serovar Miami]|uniref:Uncharacterized protein n=1 Tax=Salmonella abortus-equi TaxID=607 RepID=A0A738ATU9_SALAE|nr:hypothetical protein [Salmonella enterica]ECZ0089918.1 hypothetical protein [Salmonella enterica subsp. enterica serovar Miami]EHT1866217.1 hypothetical protein [Salmonella enterica subsp. enterica serovar Molade]HAE8734610.1 hypothetical protein [Salmonella enterica subsp. enterica serovar Abortusequi]HDI5730206.1 hypothetical protein [Salmonella enterica subsp. enterica serovar Typhisuis]EAS0440060.1 hypothetical protein [Salmonella enterica]